MTRHHSISIARSMAFGLAVVLGAAMNAGCGSKAETSEIVVPAPRIVSVTPSMTALVRGLGQGEHLVGVTTYCDAPGVPVVGDMSATAAALLMRRPDLVVAGAYRFNTDQIAGYQASGLNVLSLPLNSLADLRTAARALAGRLDAGPAAERLIADLDGALTEARTAATAWAGNPPKVLLVFDRSGGMVTTTGGGDHLAELLGAAGATNIAAGGPLTTRLSFERVLQLAPDLIIHTGTSVVGADGTRAERDAAARTSWANMATIPAVKTGQIMVWPNANLTIHGPAIPGELRRLTTAVAAAVAARDAPKTATGAAPK